MLISKKNVIAILLVLYGVLLSGMRGTSQEEERFVTVEVIEEGEVLCISPNQSAPTALELLLTTLDQEASQTSLALAQPVCLKTENIENSRAINYQYSNKNYEKLKKRYLGVSDTIVKRPRRVKNVIYECGIDGCDYSHLTLPALKEHRWVHLDQRKFECSICHHSIWKEAQGKSHIATRHPGQTGTLLLTALSEKNELLLNADPITLKVRNCDLEKNPQQHVDGDTSVTLIDNAFMDASHNSSQEKTLEPLPGFDQFFFASGNINYFADSELE